MGEYSKNLGKVCITSEGTYDATKEYDRLCLVNKTYPDGVCQAYISRKQVPVGASPLKSENTEYWLWFSTQITIGEITIDSDGTVYIDGNPTDFVIDIDEAVANAINNTEIENAIVQDLQRQINTLSRSVSSIGTTVNGLGSRVSTLENNLGTLQGVVNQNSHDIEELQRNQGGGGSGGGGGQSSDQNQSHDNIISCGNAYLITEDNAGDLVVAYSDRGGGNITISGEDVCAFLIFVGVNSNGGDTYVEENGYNLNDFLNARYPTAGVGTRVIIRSHMYYKPAGPSGIGDSAYDYDYSPDIYRIEDILDALDIYTDYTLFCATKVAPYTWTAPCFIGRVPVDKWNVVPENLRSYKLRVTDVFPYITGRTHIELGIWNESRLDYDYQEIALNTDIGVTENDVYTIRITTDYLAQGPNYDAWIENGVVSEDTNITASLTQIDAYRVLLNDVSDGPEVDDFQWMQNPGNSLGTRLNLTSPSAQLTYEQGRLLVLLGIPRNKLTDEPLNHKTFIACNTNSLSSNIEPVLSDVAVTEKEANLLECDNYSTYDGGIKVGCWRNPYYAKFAGFWLLIECPSDKGIQVNIIPQVLNNDVPDVIIPTHIGTYGNNAKLVYFEIKTLQTTIEDNTVLGTIQIGEKASPTQEIEFIDNGTLDDGSPLSFTITKIADGPVNA